MVALHDGGAGRQAAAGRAARRAAKHERDVLALCVALDEPCVCCAALCGARERLNMGMAHTRARL